MEVHTDAPSNRPPAEGTRVRVKNKTVKTSEGERDLLRVKTNRGAEKTVSTAKYRVTGRGGKGWEMQKNGRISEIIPDAINAPAPLPDKKE